MESSRTGGGGRKVVPNYLLEDYGAASDGKLGANSSGAAVHSHAVATTATAGPSSHPSSATNDSSDSSSRETSAIPRRKKKLRQACVYCRRSHLVCEEKRPCSRCVKRGIADRCADSQVEEAADGRQQPASVSPPLRSHSDTKNQSFLAPPQGTAKRRRNDDASSRHSSPSNTVVHPPHYSNANMHVYHHPPPPHLVNGQSAPRGSSSTTLLQGQPIFQPPSSAELDSLFSSYFFDVADAFSANSRFLPQTQPMQTPALAPDAHFSPHALVPLQNQQPLQQPLQQQHQYQHHPPHLQHHAPAVSDKQHDHPPPGQSYARPTFVEPSSSQQSTGSSDLDGVGVQQRQKPGDVYAPYPYRKGYASLMRYMTEQNWSENSIRSVEAALSKIRKLWFSLEDNIQPSSMIQLQAEWAGNVRYFSESVLPFTPIPMVVCRKAGEVYGCNELALDLCKLTREQMTGGTLSCYEIMTEESASHFFRLYEKAIGGAQQSGDGPITPLVGFTAPLYWNADIVVREADKSTTIVPTRGIFEMKIAPCGLPSLLVCCFVPLG